MRRYRWHFACSSVHYDGFHLRTFESTGRERGHAPSPARPTEVIPIKSPLVDAPDPGGPRPPGRPGPPARILVVEDHEDSREMLRLLLQLEGYEVEVAPDGQTGVDAALARPPMIALIDLGLPVLDGYEVARILRDRFGRSVWLIALTSRTASADRRKSAEAGYDLHVAKPVAPDRLRGILRDIASREHMPSS